MIEFDIEVIAYSYLFIQPVSGDYWWESHFNVNDMMCLNWRSDPVDWWDQSEMKYYRERVIVDEGRDLGTFESVKKGLFDDKVRAFLCAKCFEGPRKPNP